jgi:Ca2+-binding RTX toxin-like protein
MRVRSALAGACVATIAMGLTAPMAMAGDIRPDTDTATGTKRLLFSESRTITGPVDPVTGKTPSTANPETNTLVITQVDAGTIKIADTTGPTMTTAIGGPAASRCTKLPAENAVTCPIAGIQQLRLPVGLLDDTVDNQTAVPSSIEGGIGQDRIINSGAGNDLVSIDGNAQDTVQSCGGGVDQVKSDRFDVVDPSGSCEYINTPIPTGPTPPVANPTNPGVTVIAPSPVGTKPAGVTLGRLGVAPLKGAGVCVTPFIGTAGIDRILGTGGGDIAYGLAGNDYLAGGLGSDCLYGLDGNDTVTGDAGVDLVVGNNGDDKLYGGAGNDRIYGLAGIDRLQGDDGNDRMSGGSSNDRLFGLLGADSLLGGLGNDSIDGGPGNDTLSGGGGRDRLIGGTGKDKITAGGSGADSISGGAGDDIVSARNRFRDRIDCGSGRDRVTADKRDIVRNCERVTRR